MKNPLLYQNNKKLGSMRPKEDDEQIAIINWSKLVKYKNTTLSEYIHHSPNGGARRTKTDKNGNVYCPEGKKFKKMGVRAGYPDLIIDIAKGGYFGMRIELKTRTGTLQNNQENELNKLSSEGYFCIVCYGADDAIGKIKSYINLPNTKNT